MEKVSTLGVDLAKNSFQLCGMNRKGKILFNKKVNRDKFLNFVNNLDIDSDFLVASEACAGAHYWGRRLQSSGFDIKFDVPINPHSGELVR